MIQSSPFDVKPAELIRAAKELQLEGVIAKRKGSIYEPGKRSGAWVKYKINRSQEFVIGGYTAGNPFDALIVGCYDGGKLKYVGKVRAGFVPHIRCAMMPLLQEWGRINARLRIYREKRRTLYSVTRDEMQECQWLSTDRLPNVDPRRSSHAIWATNAGQLAGHGEVHWITLKSRLSG